MRLLRFWYLYQTQFLLPWYFLPITDIYFLFSFLEQSLEVTEFVDIVPLMRPLMHCVCLVYANSTYYNSPARIIGKKKYLWKCYISRVLLLLSNMDGQILRHLFRQIICFVSKCFFLNLQYWHFLYCFGFNLKLIL